MLPEDMQIPLVLGRPFINRVEAIGRKITRHGPHYSLDRLEGITAIMKIRNEPLIYESIQSILPFVQELIIVDSSTTSFDIPHSPKIQYIHTPAEQNMQFKIGMLLSKHRWILRWDGDFKVASELPQLLEITKQHPKGFWQVKALVRNINKNNVSVSVQRECYLFTYHPEILTVDFHWETWLTDMIARVKGGMPGRICYGTLPYFFGDVLTTLVFANHYFENKSDERLIEREYQAQWSLLSDAQRGQYNRFEDFVQDMVVIE